MKNAIIVALLFLICCSSFAQQNTSEHSDCSAIIQYYNDGNILLGYRGEAGKRLKIVFTKAIPSSKKSNLYEVSGKILFNQQITDFLGTMALISLESNVENSLIPNEYGQYNWGTGIFQCDLKEEKKEGGIYTGTLTFYWSMDENQQIVLNDAEAETDGYSNFIFEGLYKKANSDKTQPVKWGDQLLIAPIGFMGDDGMFYVKVKDPKNKLGWKTYKKAYQLKEQDFEALDEEQSIWWK